MSDGSACRRRRRQVRARRAELTAHSPESAYAILREEAARGDFGPHPSTEGWLYEAFHAQDKDGVFVAARSGQPIGGADVVAASRVYTPEPIVDLILHNTLGAMWCAMYPESTFGDSLTMLVPEAVGPRREPRALRDFRVIDPCCGSGAFLVAAFHLFERLAEDERHLAARGLVSHDRCLDPDEQAGCIVRECLWGADLDDGAVAIARRDIERLAGTRPAQIRALEGSLGSLEPGVFGGQLFDVVCTNPPWVGFRQLDRQVREAVTRAVPLAASDLAVAMQAAAWNLVAPGGRIGTVTPASWLAARPARPLRECIMDQGGPLLAAQLGQRVFGEAPLVFVGVSVCQRGVHPESVATMRGSAGPEAENLGELLESVRRVPRSAIESLDALSFVPTVPERLLRSAGRRRTIGDVARTFDGVWTGNNRRDLRYWWEIDHGDRWVAMSGGQGYSPWVAPTMLRARAADVEHLPDRSGCLEYSRVAGGRLGVRVAQPATAALAGVVTILVGSDDPTLRAEILAVCNSAVGAAWVSTLSTGLNFNPGYLAQIPLGAGPVDADLVEVVERCVQAHARVVAANPAHDGFTGAANPWGDDVRVHLPGAVAAVDECIADHLTLTDAERAALPVPPARRTAGRPEDDLYLEAALRSVGFRWPNDPPTSPTSASGDDVVDVLRDVRDRSGAPAGDGTDPVDWVRTRLDGCLQRVFRRRPVVRWADDVLSLARRDD